MSTVSHYLHSIAFNVANWLQCFSDQKPKYKINEEGERYKQQNVFERMNCFVIKYFRSLWCQCARTRGFNIDVIMRPKTIKSKGRFLFRLFCDCPAIYSNTTCQFIVIVRHFVLWMNWTPTKTKSSIDEQERRNQNKTDTDRIASSRKINAWEKKTRLSISVKRKTIAIAHSHFPNHWNGNENKAK